jgi:hypothetical protein
MTPLRHILVFTTLAIIVGAASALGFSGWLEHGTQYAGTEMTGGDFTMIARAGQPAVGSASGGEWTLHSGGVHMPQDICAGDMNGSGSVDIEDLLAFLAVYGTEAADLNGDGVGDVNDLLILLGAFGGCG